MNGWMGVQKLRGVSHTRIVNLACLTQGANEKSAKKQNAAFKQAIELYTKAAKLCAECGDPERSSKLLGNRAECNLRLKNWELALSDATESLALDSTNAKSQARKEKAELALAELAAEATAQEAAKAAEAAEEEAQIAAQNAADEAAAAKKAAEPEDAEKEKKKVETMMFGGTETTSKKKKPKPKKKKK